MVGVLPADRGVGVVVLQAGMAVAPVAVVPRHRRLAVFDDVAAEITLARGFEPRELPALDTDPVGELLAPVDALLLARLGLRVKDTPDEAAGALAVDHCLAHVVDAVDALVALLEVVRDALGADGLVRAVARLAPRVRARRVDLLCDVNPLRGRKADQEREGSIHFEYKH